MTDSGEQKRPGRLAYWLGTLWAEIKVVRLSWLEWACAGFLILVGFNGLFATGHEQHLKRFQRDFNNHHFEEEYKVYREWSGRYLYYNWRESRVVNVSRIVIFGTKPPGRPPDYEIINDERVPVPPRPVTYLLEYRGSGEKAVLVNGDQSAFELYRQFAYD